MVCLRNICIPCIQEMMIMMMMMMMMMIIIIIIIIALLLTATFPLHLFFFSVCLLCYVASIKYTKIPVFWNVTPCRQVTVDQSTWRNISEGFCLQQHNCQKHKPRIKYVQSLIKCKIECF